MIVTTASELYMYVHVAIYIHCDDQVNDLTSQHHIKILKHGVDGHQLEVRVNQYNMTDSDEPCIT